MHSWRNGRRSRLRSGRRKAWRFKSSRVHHFASCRRHACRHTNPARGARFAKRPRHRSYTPTFPGSSPGASTIRFVSLVAKAPARHAEDPRFESATKHQFSRSSKAERPADNRKTADRYRAGEPAQETNMTTTIRKPGRLAAVSPSPMDPERSSLRRLGNGLLIRAPARRVLMLRSSRIHASAATFVGCRGDLSEAILLGFNSSGSSNRHHHTRLAQLVRAPSS